MASRAPDWFRQAERDVEQAADSRRAVKALHLHLGQEAWGHVVAKLLRDLPASAGVPPALVEQGQVLDTFYIPPRYPNSHPEGAPFEHYGPLQSEEALRSAGAIIEFVRRRLA